MAEDDSNLSAADSNDSTNLSQDQILPSPTIDTDSGTEDLAASTSVSTPAPRSMVRIITADVTHKQVEAKDVIEYEWPVKSGDKYFLQEQIGELLDIKSFSRKFPDLSRRKVDKDERDYLLATFKIQDILNETQLRDLCAMRSMEIHHLMATEYPHIYQEYQKAASERVKAIMLEQAKEMEAIKNDSKKLAELREKAIKSALEYNKELQMAKKLERQHYWDVQTSIIQSSSRKWKKMSPLLTKPDPYPVALIHGQYQSYYKKFTPDEMRKLPLGTVLDGANLFPVYREPSPPPINVSEKDLQRFAEKAQQQPQNANGTAATVAVKTEVLNTPKVEPTTPASSGRKSSIQHGALKCATCGDGAGFGGKMIRCASCNISVHPECLDMNDEMAVTVFTYAWNCLECKKCTICSKGENEDEIMFCDRCDRGYHTYCVGLKSAPQGQWICGTHCAVEVRKTSNNNSTPTRRTQKKPASLAV